MICTVNDTSCSNKGCPTKSVLTRRASGPRFSCPRVPRPSTYTNPSRGYLVVGCWMRSWTLDDSTRVLCAARDTSVHLEVI